MQRPVYTLSCQISHLISSVVFAEAIRLIRHVIHLIYFHLSFDPENCVLIMIG